MTITRVTHHKGFFIACTVWLFCILAALLGAYFREGNLSTLWTYGVVAAIPALTGLVLWSKLRQEWAQVVVLFAWLSLAITACLAIAYIPMVLLFLCVPAVGALFDKERVVEGLLLASVFACLLYFGARNDFFANLHIASPEQMDWSIKAGFAATISFLVAAMYGAAGNGPAANSAALNKHKDILNTVPSGLISVSQDNYLTFATDMMRDIFDIPRDSRLLPAAVLFEPEHVRTKFKRLITTARERGVQVQTNFSIRDLKEKTRYLQITASPLYGGDVIVHCYDLTSLMSEVVKLRKTSETARDDAKNRTLFFSGVSHELRTPLNAIIGFSDMMRSRLFGPLPGKYADYADMIHDSGQHMLDLIGDVLDMSKIEAGKYDLNYDSFDAADVIRSSVKMIQPSADSAEVQLSSEILNEDEELIVTADRKALRQIILNLLSNAVKFTTKGGRVTVKGKVQNDDFIMIVVDEGVGISPEELKQIGKPFMQSQSGRDSDVRSSGLGLSLVRSLAELHGGKMEIQSQEGKGTRVTVTLPYEPRRMPRA